MDQQIKVTLEPVGDGEDQRLEVRLENKSGGYLVLLSTKNARKAMEKHTEAKRVVEGK